MNDLDTEIGKYAHMMMREACPFDEAWYDWDIDELKVFIHDNSKNDFVHLEFSYEDLGHGQKWYDKQCRILNHDLLKIKREILLEWTLANDTSPFSEEQLTEIRQYAGGAIGKFYVMKKYKFEMFSEMKNILNKSWLIGIDIGGGLKKDFTAITISDPATRQIKAIFKSNNIGLPELVDLVVNLVIEFLPNGVIIPERNNLGIAFIQLLLKTEVANNMYYEVREKQGEKVIEDPKNTSKRKVKAKTRVYGVQTTKESRDIMMNEILNHAVNEEPYLFTSKYIFEEIRTLERKKTGKVEHRDGCHDDILFSWLVSSYALLYGNNVSKFVKVTSDGKNEEDNERSRNVSRNIYMLYNQQESNLTTALMERYKQEGHFSFDNEEKTIDMRKKKRLKNMSFISGLNKR